MLNFRRARRADVPAIVGLLADDMLGQGRERTDMAPYLAAFDAIGQEGGNQVIVAVDGAGAVLATYQITFISGLSISAARRAQVESVRVARGMRGQGVGKAMFDDVETRARAAGCSLIQLTMNAERKDSRKFYEALGFSASHIGFKRALTPS